MDRNDLTRVISFISAILGLLIYVIKLSYDYSRLKTKVENNEARDKEERERNEARFTELFNSRNKTNDVLTELTTTIKMMADNINERFKSIEIQIKNLEKEIRDLKRGSN